jgi:sugar/nucleoside kinase (ribokinase family)
MREKTDQQPGQWHPSLVNEMRGYPSRSRRMPAMHPPPLAVDGSVGEHPTPGDGHNGCVPIVVAGKLVVDEILQLAMPVLPGGRQRALNSTITGGGQVWHTSRVIRAAGVECAATGWAGGDADSAMLRQQLAEAGVTDHLVVAGQASRSTVLVGPDGDRSIISRGGPATLSPSQLVDTRVLDGAAWLHIDGYGFDDGVGEAFVTLARAAAEHGVPVSLEPPSPQHRDRVAGFLAALPPLEAVLGNPDEVAMVEQMLATPPRYVVIHDGPNEAICRGPSGEVRQRPAMTPAVTNGAGDRFAGGWIAAAVRGASPPERLTEALGSAARA